MEVARSDEEPRSAPDEIGGAAQVGPVRAGPLSIEVETDDAVVADRIDHLLAGFAHVERSLGRAIDRESPVDHLRVSIRRRAAADDTGPEPTYDSWIDGKALATAVPLHRHEILLTRELNERKLDAEPHLLHLHSASVVRDDAAVLLLGRSGSGKSSLTAGLVRAGWGYVTDEQVAIDPARGEVSPYPRPITLRQRVWREFPELEPFPSGMSDDIHLGPRVEVSPVDLGEVVTSEGTAVRAIVSVRFSAEGSGGLVEMPTVADVVAEMVSCCYDLERLGLTGARLLVDLAARCRGWSLVYGSIDDGIEMIDQALTRSIGRTRIPVDEEPPNTAGGAGAKRRGRLGRSGSAWGWRFGDGSAVVIDLAQLRLARLDEAGFDLWRLLAAEPTLDEFVRSAGADQVGGVDGVDAWLDSMAAAGLIVMP